MIGIVTENDDLMAVLLFWNSDDASFTLSDTFIGFPDFFNGVYPFTPATPVFFYEATPFDL